MYFTVAARNFLRKKDNIWCHCSDSLIITFFYYSTYLEFSSVGIGSPKSPEQWIVEIWS